MSVRRRARALRSVVLALGVALAATGTAVHAQNRGLQEDVQSLVARAEAALRAGDREGALLLLARLDDRLGESNDFSDTVRPTVLGALVFHAQTLWEDDQRQQADGVLDRIIEVDPRYEMPASVPEGLAERYAARRERKVGFLRIGLFPADADVTVDGEALDPVPDLYPVLAGPHEVVASRPGYAAGRQEVDVRANRTMGVGFTLERASATMRIVTSPPGATVVVDGDVIGRTVPAAGDAEKSEPLVIEGLLPGRHDLEVTLADHRPFRQRIEVPTLSDYDLGTLVMERSLGVVVLRDLPADADVRVDGEEVQPERQVATDGRTLSGGAARMSLPVGEHRVAISAPGGVFEAPVTVGDGESVGVDVRLRPGIAFLGVDGGEQLDREAVRAQIEPVLEAADGWFILDRAGVASSPVRPGDAGWPSAREDLARRVPEASLFLHVEVPDTSPADHYLVQIWAPPPGPVRALELSVPLGDAAGAAPVADALDPRLPRGVAWLGATLVDSALTDGALVVAVSRGGPAEQAGIAAGDRIVGLDGAPVRAAADVWQRVESAAPFESVALEVASGGERRAVGMTLGTSPHLPRRGGGAPPVVWAAAGAELAAGGTAVPAWTLGLTRGLVLLDGGDVAGAVAVLGGLQVAGATPFGQAAVDYWLGVALSSGSVPDLAAARSALERAAAVPDARLEDNDGPRVSPRAMARLAAIEAAAGS